MKTNPNLAIRLIAGFGLGACISYVDNFAFQGEVSPIVIVLLLLVTAACLAAVWKWQALIPVILIWAWLPLAHVAKKMLGIHDTLNPNTYSSILLLAGFCLVVSAFGFLIGVTFNKVLKNNR